MEKDCPSQCCSNLWPSDSESSVLPTKLTGATTFNLWVSNLCYLTWARAIFASFWSCSCLEWKSSAGDGRSAPGFNLGGLQHAVSDLSWRWFKSATVLRLFWNIGGVNIIRTHIDIQLELKPCYQYVDSHIHINNKYICYEKYILSPMQPHFGLLKQQFSRIYLKIISYKFFKISLQIYVIVGRNKKNPTSLHFFALKTDNSPFCNRDIPTIHNGYCVS